MQSNGSNHDPKADSWVHESTPQYGRTGSRTASTYTAREACGKTAPIGLPEQTFLSNLIQQNERTALVFHLIAIYFSHMRYLERLKNPFAGIFHESSHTLHLLLREPSPGIEPGTSSFAYTPFCKK